MATDEQIAFRDQMAESGGIAVAGHYVLTPEKDGWRYLLTLDGFQIAEFGGVVDLLALADLSRRAIARYRADKQAMRKAMRKRLEAA